MSNSTQSSDFSAFPQGVDNKMQIVDPTYSANIYKPPEKNITRGRISKRFIVDSRDRLEGTPQDYVLDLPDEFHNVISVELVQATIPQSGYNVGTHNNAIYFEETLGQVLCAYVPPGQYTAADLATAVATAMTDADGAKSTYTVSLNTTTKKYTITSDLAGGDGYFRLRFADANCADQSVPKYPRRSIGQVLGFARADLTYASGCASADQGTHAVWGVGTTAFKSDFAVGDKFRFECDATIYTVAKVCSDSTLETVEEIVADVDSMRIVLSKHTAQGVYNLEGEQYLILDIPELYKLDALNPPTRDAFAILPLDPCGCDTKVFDHGTLSRISPMRYFNPPESRILKLRIRFLTYSGELYDFNGREHMLDFDVQYLNAQGFYNNLPQP